MASFSCRLVCLSGWCPIFAELVVVHTSAKCPYLPARLYLASRYAMPHPHLCLFALHAFSAYSTLHHGLCIAIHVIYLYSDARSIIAIRTLQTISCFHDRSDSIEDLPPPKSDLKVGFTRIIAWKCSSCRQDCMCRWDSMVQYSTAQHSILK